MISYAFVDEVEEDIFIDHPIPLIDGEWNAASYSPVLLSRRMPVEFLNHVYELLSVLHLDIAEEMAEEVDH